MASRTYTIAQIDTAFGIDVVAIGAGMVNHLKGLVIERFKAAHGNTFLFWTADVTVVFDENNLFQISSASLTTAQIGTAIG